MIRSSVRFRQAAPQRGPAAPPGCGRSRVEQLAGRDPHHRTRVDLEASVAHLLDSPPDHGTVELVLVRPSERHRVVLSEGWLDPVLGMQGDSWPARPWLRTPRGGPDTAAQLSVTNARVNALVAGG